MKYTKYIGSFPGSTVNLFVSETNLLQVQIKVASGKLLHSGGTQY